VSHGRLPVWEMIMAFCFSGRALEWKSFQAFSVMGLHHPESETISLTVASINSFSNQFASNISQLAGSLWFTDFTRRKLSRLSDGTRFESMWGVELHSLNVISLRYSNSRKSLC
jgi:hypothetical protein